MEYRNKMIKEAITAAMLLLMTACDSNEDKWTPGPAVTPVNQVYFAEESPETQEISVNQEYTYTVTLSREDETTEISVPIAVTADEGFEVPPTVDFAAGEKTAEVTVRFNGTDKTGYYSCNISIEDEDYCNPYTMLTTSVDVQILVARWELLYENVRFYDGSYTLADWYADLYTNEMEDGTMYRFTGFMQSQDLTFELREISGYSGYYDIFPAGGSSVQYDGYGCWYFGGIDEDEYATSYRLYPYGTENYLDYVCIYTGSGEWYSVMDFTGWYYENYGNDGFIAWEFYMYPPEGGDYTYVNNSIYFVFPRDNE